jgi:hypothetical protein
MHGLIFGAVFGFEEDEFAGASWVQELEDDGSSKTAEEGAPENLAWKVGADLDTVSADGRD